MKRKIFALLFAAIFTMPVLAHDLSMKLVDVTYFSNIGINAL